MTHEIVPDTPCPHCERQNTTLRRSIEEDGFTKVSRVCTACGGEWTHTWDRDWLADAKNRKLRAENERLRAEVERLRHEDTLTRHALNGWVWVCPDGGDEPTHERVSAVVSEVEKQRAERERLRAALREIARLGALVAHDLQGRVEAGKVMAVQRMADEARAAWAGRRVTRKY